MLFATDNFKIILVLFTLPIFANFNCADALHTAHFTRCHETESSLTLSTLCQNGFCNKGAEKLEWKIDFILAMCHFCLEWHLALSEYFWFESWEEPCQVRCGPCKNVVDLEDICPPSRPGPLAPAQPLVARWNWHPLVLQHFNCLRRGAEWQRMINSKIASFFGCHHYRHIL